MHDLISDSNKDFIIGSSSVVINESDHGTTSVRALSNPLSSSQYRGELPPPIVSGPCDAPDLEDMYSIRHQSGPINPKRGNKNASVPQQYFDSQTSDGLDQKNLEEQQHQKRKKR